MPSVILTVEEEEQTCCHRVTYCPLRDVLVTSPVINEKIPLTFGTLFWAATVAAHLCMFYMILYFHVGDPMLPGGSIFGLLSIIIFAYFLGWSLAYLPYLNLPPVLGMLLAGIIVRNADWYNIQEELGLVMHKRIMTFSVTFLMIRAGLQLKTRPIREHSLFVVNLAFIPCTTEMFVIALCGHYILDYPWAWALLCGSVIACVSPVVPINCMLALAERGYGVDNDIAAILFAAASIDDIHIVCLYALFYSSIFSHGTDRKWKSYLFGLSRDISVGIIAGISLGIFFIFFPHRKHEHVVWYRTTGLLLGSLMCTTTAASMTITGGGFLATIVMSVISTTGWKKISAGYDWMHNIEMMRHVTKIIWHLMQPVMVGTIGANIDFREWELHRFALYCLCIFIGMLVRMLITFLCTYTDMHHTTFKFSERVFIAFSWISKGTLQAALAPMAAEQAAIEGDKEIIKIAMDIVGLSVVSICILAPLGSVVMTLTGPLLLTKASDDDIRKQQQISQMRSQSIQVIRSRKAR